MNLTHIFSGFLNTKPSIRPLAVAMLCLLLPLMGCWTRQAADGPKTVTLGPATATDAPVENLFTSTSLPADIRRVVLLPVHYSAYDENVHAYLDELWMQAIQRQNRFEVIMLDRETMDDWSGKSQWSSTVPLPGQLRNHIQMTFQPDAILLCDLTRLESYQPLEIGLRTKLYHWTDGTFLWGVDGVWTQKPGGSVEAKPSALAALFKKSRKKSENTLDLATISPRYFYYHLVESVALTLPNRHAQ